MDKWIETTKEGAPVDIVYGTTLIGIGSSLARVIAAHKNSPKTSPSIDSGVVATEVGMQYLTRPNIGTVCRPKIPELCGNVSF